MRKAPVRYDPRLVYVTIVLTIVGIITLASSSMGALDTNQSLLQLLGVQLVGAVLGYVAIYFAIFLKKLDYRMLYKQHHAVYFFILAILLQLVVFTPIGIERNGATRWIDLGVTTFQPSEILKIALVLLLGTLLVGYRKKINKFRTILCIVASTAGVVTLLMLLIRDKGTLLISALACLAMLVAARVKLLHLLSMVVLAAVLLLGYVTIVDTESYAKDRLVSFLGLENNPLKQDYQINQSIITIGSGQIMGRGLGQSIQKHTYLPEPLTDSIFAVYAEEWGFVGSVVLILLYFVFLFYAFEVAKYARDDYGRYIVIGLTVLIVAQSLFNIMALIKLVPLSGMPLVFVSKGGTSLMTALWMVAIILNVSRISHTGRKPRRAQIAR